MFITCIYVYNSQIDDTTKIVEILIILGGLNNFFFNLQGFPIQNRLNNITFLSLSLSLCIED